MNAQQSEYDQIQEQIKKRKAKLASSGLPEDVRKLFEQIRPYPTWKRNFNYPMHPLLTSIVQGADYNTVDFTFNGVGYILHFDYTINDSYPNTDRQTTPIIGSLLLTANGVLVLESRFFGELHEYGTDFRYGDSEVYKSGPWEKDLLRFKRESNQLIEAFRVQQDAAKKRDPAVLKAMREKFNIPEVPISRTKEVASLVGRLFAAIFSK